MSDEYKIVRFSSGYYGVQTGKSFVCKGMREWIYAKDVINYCQMSLRQARKLKGLLTMEVVEVLDE